MPFSIAIISVTFDIPSFVSFADSRCSKLYSLSLLPLVSCKAIAFVALKMKI